ncbi:MAG: YbjN domain-containing protein [Microthrixaceae bacterium]
MGDTENDAIDLEHANGWLAFEMLGQLLDQEEFHPEQMSETTAYRFGVAGTNGNFRVVVHCNVELEQLYVYVLTDVRVPEDRRLAVAELFTRANYGMRIGNFELDLRDGEVRYKSSVDFEHNALTASLAMNALMPALGTMVRLTRSGGHLPWPDEARTECSCQQQRSPVVAGASSPRSSRLRQWRWSRRRGAMWRRSPGNSTSTTRLWGTGFAKPARKPTAVPRPRRSEQRSASSSASWSG